MRSEIYASSHHHGTSPKWTFGECCNGQSALPNVSTPANVSSTINEDYESLQLGLYKLQSHKIMQSEEKIIR